MIALIASALLGLYVFVPYIAFHRLCSLFLRLKQFQRTKTDEIVFGIIVAGLPFLLSLFLFWHGWIGRDFVPYGFQDSHALKVSDYREVVASVYSDAHFKDHEKETWDAATRVFKRQFDFLAWNYVLVLLEIALYVILTSQYGRLKNRPFYAWIAARILLPAVSEWHVLLTNFSFPPEEHRQVKVDAMTKDNMLYQADLANYFLGQDGELSGLLLENTRRFQFDRLKADIVAGTERTDHEEYWRPVAGVGIFYLPSPNLASLNIRYPLRALQYEEVIRNAVEDLKIKGMGILEVEAFGRCACPDTRHGHGNPCGATTNEGQSICDTCREKIACEIRNAQETAGPQDVPPA